MKVVVAIHQCRRAVMPHIFLEYALPKMRALFSGTIEVVLVQHRVDASGGRTNHESFTMNPTGLDRVRQWTEEGRYDKADEIITHNVVHKPYPSIPTFHRGVRAAVDRNADFLLWMEDDAIVCDPNIDYWDKLMGGRELAVYSNFHHISAAYFVSRPSFFRRILPYLEDYSRWKYKSQHRWMGLRIEPFLRSQLRTKRARFPNRYAVRYHHRYVPYIGLRYLVDAVRELAPEALPLLEVDFGPEAMTALPVSPDEMKQHARQERNKVMDHVWVTYEGLRQRFWLPEELPERERLASK